MNLFQYLCLIVFITAVILPLLHYYYRRKYGTCVECAAERFLHNAGDFDRAASRVSVEVDEEEEEEEDKDEKREKQKKKENEK